MNYKALVLLCPHCHQPIQTVGVALRADHMIRVDGVCSTCERHLCIEEKIEDCIPKDTLIPNFDFETWVPKGKPN